MNYRGAASRSRSRLRCYWVATRAVDRLDIEIAGLHAVIKDVVDSGHSENIPKLRRLARALCKPCSIFSPSLPFVAHLGHVLT